MNSDHVAKLPIDLVLEICRYLPLRSIACLALSKKPLYHAQDMQRLWRPRLSPSQQIFRGPKDFASHDLGSEWGECQMLHRRKDICNHELLLFLELLKHDLPSHWQCDLCMKLHRRVEHTASGRAYRPCLASQTQGVFYQLPEWKYTIPFGDAQQIIKRHTGGKQSAIGQVKRLSHLSSHRWSGINDWKLILRFEYIEVLETRSRDWVRNIGQKAQNHLAICCHQHDIGERVAEILESQMSLWGASPRSLRGRSPSYPVNMDLAGILQRFNDPQTSETLRQRLQRLLHWRRFNTGFDPSRSGEPEHELCRTISLTGTVNSQRSRDRVVADATRSIPVQVEEQDLLQYSLSQFGVLSSDNLSKTSVIIDCSSIFSLPFLDLSPLIMDFSFIWFWSDFRLTIVFTGDVMLHHNQEIAKHEVNVFTRRRPVFVKPDGQFERPTVDRRDKSRKATKPSFEPRHKLLIPKYEDVLICLTDLDDIPFVPIKIFQANGSKSRRLVVGEEICESLLALDFLWLFVNIKLHECQEIRVFNPLASETLSFDDSVHLSGHAAMGTEPDYELVYRVRVVFQGSPTTLLSGNPSRTPFGWVSSEAQSAMSSATSTTRRSRFDTKRRP
ncbi:hypothetical protein KCV06_g138, partial [Aureobasidium melanogenum]